METIFEARDDEGEEETVSEARDKKGEIEMPPRHYREKASKKAGGHGK